MHLMLQKINFREEYNLEKDGKLDEKTRNEYAVKRDELVYQQLSELGWNILVVWECELKRDKRENTLEYLYYNILRNNKE